MLVWIPRYAYKITSKYHQSGSNAGTIEIVFLNTANEDKDGNSYSGKTAYPSANTGSGMADYVVHPSFNWDGVPLAGYWVVPSSNIPFFLRGGYCIGGSCAGLFVFDYNNGDAWDYYSFRVVVPVL